MIVTKRINLRVNQETHEYILPKNSDISPLCEEASLNRFHPESRLFISSGFTGHINSFAMFHLKGAADPFTQILVELDNFTKQTQMNITVFDRKNTKISIPKAVFSSNLNNIFSRRLYFAFLTRFADDLIIRLSLAHEGYSWEGYSLSGGRYYQTSIFYSREEAFESYYSASFHPKLVNSYNGRELFSTKLQNSSPAEALKLIKESLKDIEKVPVISDLKGNFIGV